MGLRFRRKNIEIPDLLGIVAEGDKYVLEQIETLCTRVRTWKETADTRVLHMTALLARPLKAIAADAADLEDAGAPFKRISSAAQLILDQTDSARVIISKTILFAEAADAFLTAAENWRELVGSGDANTQDALEEKAMMETTAREIRAYKADLYKHGLDIDIEA